MKLKKIFLLVVFIFLLLSEIFSDDDSDFISIVFNPNLKNYNITKEDEIYLYVNDRLDLCKKNIKINDAIKLPKKEKFIFVLQSNNDKYYISFLPDGTNICKFKPFPDNYTKIFHEYGYCEIIDVLGINLEKNTVKIKFRKITNYNKDLEQQIISDFYIPVTSIKKVFYLANIENLRLRESPDTEGKVLRLLGKGEKLELLEIGNSETIKGVNGKWIKIKSIKNNDSGWCFDAYLIKIDE